MAVLRSAAKNTSRRADRTAATVAGAVVVLGHPAYYPRFGFVPASRHGIACPYDAPDEAFMIVPLMPGHLAGLAGTVEYHAAFAGIDGAAP